MSTATKAKKASNVYQLNPARERLCRELDEMPTHIVEEFVSIVQLAQSQVDPMLSMLESIPEVKGRPEVAILAKLFAAQMLVSRLEGMAV